MRSTPPTLSREVSFISQRTTNSVLAVDRPPLWRGTLLLIATLGLISFAIFDVWVTKGNWTVETSLPLPLFKEKGHAFFTYMPQPRVSALLNTNSNLLNGAVLKAEAQALKPASLESVREEGGGTFFQKGSFLWFSLPGKGGDANTPETKVTAVSQLELKTWVRFGCYGFLVALAIGTLSLTAFQRGLNQTVARFPAAAATIQQIFLPIQNFFRNERWLILSIALLLAVRIGTLPPIFNFLDTFTTLRAPLSILGAMPPLYVMLVAGLKHVFGMGHMFLNVLLCIQYGLFAVSMLYLGTAFNTVRQKLFAVLVIALNFYVSLIVGGIMTESLAVSEQILLFGASLRIIKHRKPLLRDLIILALSCTLCVVTRHTFVLFASAIAIYALAQILFSSGERKTRMKQFVVIVGLCAMGTIGGLSISSLLYKLSGPGGSVPVGLWGVQLMARGWQHIENRDREPTYAKLASQTTDPLVKATFRSLLQLPNSDQTMYDFTSIYKRIQDIVRQEYSAESYQRACNTAELSRATTAATLLFLRNPDPYYWAQVKSFFLQYTQLRELLSTENRVYQFAVVKSNDTVDALGSGWNFPNIRWGYLNRCILEHSAISDMWSHLCEDTSRITDRVFSPENKNLVRDSINGPVFWLLDFINPATNLVVLLTGIILGSWLRRLSTTGAIFGIAIVMSALIFDFFHALTTQVTLSRYLAPGSFQLAMGIVVVYSEIFFGFNLARIAKRTGNAQGTTTQSIGGN